MRLADTVLVVLAPGMGDGIQAAKAGILEIADILVVNKSDHDGAAGTVRDLKGMSRSAAPAPRSPTSWRVPVLSTVGVHGRRDRRAAGRDRRPSARISMRTAARRRAPAARAEVAVQAVVLERVHAALASAAGHAPLAAAAGEVADGGIDTTRPPSGCSARCARSA